MYSVYMTASATTRLFALCVSSFISLQCVHTPTLANKRPGQIIPYYALSMLPNYS